MDSNETTSGFSAVPLDIPVRPEYAQTANEMIAAMAHFESNGMLFPCPNPSHTFQLRRIVGQFRRASEAWTTLSS